MTTNISEKSFKELNTLMSEISVQMDELNKKKEEISAAIQKRKEQVVSDYIRHVNQLMEDTRLMVEMGIDPTSIPTESTVEDKVEDPVVVSAEETAVEEDVAGYVSSEPEVLGKEIVEVPDIVDVIEDMDTSDDTTHIDVKEDKKGSTPKKLKKGVYRPFFYLLGDRKGAFPKNGKCNKSHKSTRLLTPFYKLAGSELINRSLPMGNLKYRESFPNPDEGRIYSADGIAPTITAMHSDLYILVGHRPPAEPKTSTDAA